MTEPSYGRRLPKRADNPTVEYVIEYATGEVAQALRREQAEVVLEVLRWLARQQRSGDSPMTG